MARLPRYQAGQIQAAVPGRVEFAGMREKARFAENIGKMAAFVNREVQAREAKKTREEEEANATYQRIQSDTLKTQYSIEARKIVDEAERSTELVSMGQIQDSLSDLTDGFLASAESLDTEYAAFLQNDILGIAAVQGERYSTYHQREAVKQLQADSVAGLREITLNADAIAYSPAYSPESIENMAMQAEQFALDHQYTPIAAARQAQDIRTNMAIQNAKYKYDQLGPLEDKEKYINDLSVSGLTREENDNIKKELNGKLTQEYRNFKVKIATARREISDVISNVSSGGQVSQDQRTEIDQQVQLYANVDPSLEQDLNRMNFVLDRIPTLQQMSLSELASESSRLNSEVEAAFADDPEFENKVAMAESATQLYQTMLSQLSGKNPKPYEWFEQTGQIQVAPLTNQESIIRRQDNRDFIESKNPGFNAPFLTSSEINSTVAAFNDADPDVVVANLTAMQSLYGRNYEIAMQDLNNGGLAPEYAVGGRYLADNMGLAESIIGLRFIDEKDLKAPLLDSQVSDFKAEYKTLAQEYIAAFTAGDITGRALKDANTNFSVASKLGMQMMVRPEITPQEAAAQVFADMFPEDVVIEEKARLIIPKGNNPDSILYNLENALEPDALMKVGVAGLDDPRLPEDIDAAIDAESLSDNGVWLNNETGDGAVLHYNLNGFLLPVRLKPIDPEDPEEQPRYYDLKYNDLAKFGGKREYRMTRMGGVF